MSTPTAPRPPESEDGWSAPSIFGRGLLVEPRLYTEADPLPSFAYDEQPSLVDELIAVSERDSWSPTTYVGRRRFRPKTAAALPEAPAVAEPAAVEADWSAADAEPSVAEPSVAEPSVAEPTVDAPAVDAPALDATAADATPVDITLRPDGIDPIGAPPEWTDAGEPEAPVGTAAEQTTRGLLANSRTMAVASLASRLTGFLRNILLVTALGSGLVGDAYNSANSFPNMVYELLLGGVLSSVLIPLVVNAQEQDADGGDAYTRRLLSIATAILGITTLLAVAIAPYIAAAFVDKGSQRDLTSIFATLLLPEIFFYGLGALFTAVLNTRHVYGIGAWAPVVNNVITLVTIGIFELLPGPAILTPSSMTTPQVLVVGIGTTLGIVGQALILIPALRRAGFHWQWRFRGTPNETGRMREAGALAGWVLGYVVASQIGVTVVLKVANDHHGVTVFTNADLLFQMPYGILGVSLLTALMPRMARAAARQDNASVVRDLSIGARLSALALVPITAGLIVLGPQFTTVFFAYGQNTITGARQFGINLALAAFGLLPFAIVMLQLRVFYAMRDGRTPTLINVFMVGTKVVLILIAAATMSGVHVIEALNVATSVSYVVGAVVGHVLLTRRFGHLGFAVVGRTVALVALASAGGALAAWGIVSLATSGLGHARGAALVGLIGGAMIGLTVFAAIAWYLNIPELVAVMGHLPALGQLVRRGRAGEISKPAAADDFAGAFDQSDRGRHRGGPDGESPDP
ncbi:MAG: murein biosynthesis integral membrane protein MurJ [Actinobacteria bacterium]|nr:murein biosynthesis integral membrane protein MurJ [Actinomycetota bacterium]